MINLNENLSALLEEDIDVGVCITRSVCVRVCVSMCVWDLYKSRGTIHSIQQLASLENRGPKSPLELTIS